MKKKYMTRSCLLSLLFLLLSVSYITAQTTVTIQATGTAGTFNTGSVNAAGTKNDGDMITINSSSNRGWAEFDLSSIPAAAVVSAVTANFTTYSSTLSSATNNLYGFTGDPAVIPGATLYTNCGSGPSFNASSWTANALQSKVFNAAGIAFVDANCGSSLCIGYVRGSTNTYNIAGYPNVNGPLPELVITYSVPTPCSGMPLPGTATISSSSGCPNINFTLDATAVSADSGISYQWQSGPTASGPWTNIPGGTTIPFVTNAATTTFYQLVTTCGVSMLSNNSNTVSYTVVNPGPCICAGYFVISASSIADEDLGNVTVGTMNNSSTCASLAPGAGSIQNRYSNYTGSVTAPIVQQGQAVSFSLSSITCGGNFNNGFQIYVDYNQNGSFADPGEQAYSSAASVSGPHTETGSFTVPLSATVGTTRMRVICIETTFPTATNYAVTGYTWGETEDYCFEVAMASPVDMAVTGFIRPLTTGCYTSADSVVVQVQNQGSAMMDFSVNPMTVTVTVTGPNPATLPVTVNTGTLAVSAFMNVVVTTTYDMSAAGTYGFSATQSTTGDGFAGNDNYGPSNFVFSAGTAMASSSGNVCTGSPANVSLIGYSPSTASLQWQSSPDNIVWTNIPGQTNPTVTSPATDTTFYRAIVCGLLTSTVDTVFTITVTAATTTNDTICGLGTATLTASGSGELHWFDAQTNGTEVDTGTAYSPAVTVTDTFWVENRFVDCGAAGNPVAPTCYPAYSNACSSADFINNFSTTGGATNITNLNTGCNGAGPSNTTFFPGQSVSVGPGGTFNLAAQSGASWGQGFRLWIDYNADGDFSDPGEDVWSSAASSTALQTGSVTVPMSVSAGPKRMRLMCRFATVPVTTDHCETTLTYGEVEEYTLNVCTMCSAPRVPSIVTVTPAPAMTVATPSPTYCSGDTVTMTVTSANSNYAYAWSPATYLNTTTGTSVQAVAPNGTYTYYVDAQDAVSGCANLDSVSFSVNESPTVIASANPSGVCANTASILNTMVNTVPFAIDISDAQNTTTTYPAPYGNWYWGAKNQILILASELTAAGISAGPITGLSWEVLGLTATPLQGFNISMGHTTLTSLVTFTPGLTQVLNPMVYTPALGTNVHTFNTPFVWNGTDNIIIETCFNNNSYTTNCVMAQTTMPYTASVYYYQDATGVCAQTTPNGNDFMRPTTTLYAETNALTYLWSPSGSLSSPTASDPTAMPPGTTTYSVVVTDPATGCTATDTTTVTTFPTPDPDFGADTVICSNGSLVLDAGTGPSYTYLWQDASTAQTFTVTGFGTYSVEVTDNVSGCVGRDTILVGTNAAPSFTLGSDVTVCQGTQVSFSGPSGQYDYVWNTMDSTMSITTGVQGSYELAVTDTTNGCTSMDTVMLTVNPVPAVDLGSDTSVCSANGSVTLTAPAGSYSYQWSTLDSSMSISVNSTGNYFVVVTDTTTSCAAGDTVFITYNISPVANLGNDTTFCSANGPITLVAPAGNYSYVWNDMSTGMTLQAGTTGLYYVDVLDTVTGCTTTDSIMVNVPMTPSFSLADTSFCGTQFTISGPSGPYNYDWSTLDSTQSITVTVSGTYTLTVTDTTSGCNSSDVSTVNINANPTVALTASDNVVCVDDANVILTGTPSGGAYSGSSVTGNQFDPSIGVGIYPVVYNFTDVNGCSGTDTTSIEVNSCVGVIEPFAGAGMSIFPNPNTGKFTFFAADMNCAEMTIELTTIEGQVIYTNQYLNIQGNFTQEINTAEFANGVYIMRVTTDGAIFTQRVVKQE